MKITVDANEAMCGLAALIARQWEAVEVRRLDAGDVAVGDRVLIERKTAEDFVASLLDGRLFHQAWKLVTNAARPVIILEGDPAIITERVEPDQLRGVFLSLTIGFRMPILSTCDLADTACWIRHLAVQEAKRESRRLRAERDREAARRRSAQNSDAATKAAPPRQCTQETLDAFLALPGIGKERARALAESVGSVNDLCRLSLRELARLPGIGADTAGRIFVALRGMDEGRRAERGES